MIQINYGAVGTEGFVEVVSKQIDAKLQQKDNREARVWLEDMGIRLELRTKDRVDFSRLLPNLLMEIGLEAFILFLTELKEVKCFASNEAELSTREGYSAQSLTQTLERLFPN